MKYNTYKSTFNIKYELIFIVFQTFYTFTKTITILIYLFLFMLPKNKF